MKNCLFVFHDFGGGAERIACALASGLDRRMFCATIASMRHLPELPQCLPKGDTRVIMPRSNSFFHRVQNAFSVYEEARKSDIVIGSVELQSIFFAALFAPSKAIGWVHKDLEPYLAMNPPIFRSLYTAVFNWAATRCACMACVSEGVMESLNNAVPASKGKSRFIMNPIDTDDILAKSEEPLPHSLEECFAKPVVLGVGRLARQKAFHILIEAHAILRGRGIDHNLCILGEGPERPFLADTVNELGVGDSSFLPGSMNPYPMMKRATVLGMSSIFEGLPTVIMESMLLGLPVVSSDCPSGPRFLLEHGQCGILTPPDDVGALADGLQVMFDDSARGQYAAASFARASKFSFSSSVAAWEEFLNQSTSDNQLH